MRRLRPSLRPRRRRPSWRLAPQRDGGERPRFARGDETAPRRSGPRGERNATTRPKKRKHISVLRAEERAEQEGARRRVERSATSDRKGREVKVERISAARPPDPPPLEPPKGRARGRPDDRRRADESATHGEPRARPEREAARRSFAPRGDRGAGKAIGRRAAPGQDLRAARRQGPGTAVG